MREGDGVPGGSSDKIFPILTKTLDSMKKTWYSLVKKSLRHLFTSNSPYQRKSQIVERDAVSVTVFC